MKQKQIIYTRYAKITIVQDKDTYFDYVNIERLIDGGTINHAIITITKED